ncbi:type 1 glutamine amidotransferase, partial [Candidatus Pacearchaeota archaeon]|nr:type 1 glutamine amidotransferase [Candidatus Pacearchaeota archaeon]
MTKDTRNTILLIIARGWNSHQSELSLYPNLFRRLVELSEAPLRIRTHNIIEEGEPEIEGADRAVIIGGSPHCLDEDLPWMRTLKDFVRKVAETKTKMMGVCFGHQVIVEALGGKVERCSVGGELGEVSIDLTELGKGDDVFRDFPTTFTALAAHRDVVTELPKGAEILAKNTSNEYQALSMGDNIRSIQFHPEMTSGYFYDLIHRYKDTFHQLG